MLKVMVLDDDADNCVTLEHVLRFAGYSVQSTTKNCVFMQIIPMWIPDVVIIDLLLQHANAITVLTELPELAVKPSVIVVSGVHSRLLEAATRSIKNHGFNVLGSLSKPYNPASLRAVIARHQTTVVPTTMLATPVSDPIITDEVLVAALDNKSFYIMLQPKVDCKTTSLAGFEALCRLNLPKHGNISPDVFIPLCEKAGLINRVTELVIDQALCWFADFIHNKAPLLNMPVNNPKLALNISVASLTLPSIFNYLIGQCIKYKLKPEAIILELTETAAMTDSMSSLEILTKLRLQGFELSIDDFGTGYSSVQQLVGLPFSELKIDKQLVISASGNKESRLVIASLIEMAHTLGMSVTAEGIEDSQTLTFLQKKHCDTAQGYYIAQPMLPSQITDWTASHVNNLEMTRLKTLRSLDILNSAPEERYNIILRLTQRIFNVPICTISLIDEDRIWYKGKIGMTAIENNRDGSLCQLAIQHNDGIIVEDTLLDNTTKHNEMVIGEPYARFYAGQPVAGPNGVGIGSLCLMDFVPKEINQSDRLALQTLARMIEDELNMANRIRLDPLTKLKNRTSFDLRANWLLALCRSHRLGLNAFLIKAKIEQGKHNDHFELLHERVLLECAELIKRIFSDADLISRVDYESFVIMYVAQDEKLIELAASSFMELSQQQITNTGKAFPVHFVFDKLNLTDKSICSLQQFYVAMDI